MADNQNSSSSSIFSQISEQAQVLSSGTFNDTTVKLISFNNKRYIEQISPNFVTYDNNTENIPTSAVFSGDQTYTVSIKSLSENLAIVEDLKIAGYDAYLPFPDKCHYIIYVSLTGINHVSGIISTVTALQTNGMGLDFAFDAIAQGSLIPNDTSYSSQWHHNTVGSPLAWDITTGSNTVTVAVLDTGVGSGTAGVNNDIKPKLVTGASFVTTENDTIDRQGHGTMCAHLIGAVTNNSLGVAGIDWNCRIAPVKVLDAAGNGSMSWFAAGVLWAADNNCDVISASLGTAPNTPTDINTINAIDYAINNKNCIVVVAAGNDGPSGANNSPANCTPVIAVGATTNTNSIASFSSIQNGSLGGRSSNVLTLSAPGQAVVTINHLDQTVSVNGTSFACPIVAGCCSLIKSINKNFTHYQIKDFIERSTGQSYIDYRIGFGILNVRNALMLAQSGPQTPTPTPTNTVTPTKTPTSTGIAVTATQTGTQNPVITNSPTPTKTSIAATPTSTPTPTQDLLPPWIQRGNNIFGDANISSKAGSSVSLNSTGDVLAIGSATDLINVSAAEKVYFWDGSSWIQRGNDIISEEHDDLSGRSTSLNAAGNIIAIGSPFNNGNASNNSGSVRVYSWDGNIWNKLGADIDGKSSGDNAGWSVSLNALGNILAIGAPGNNGGTGVTRIYAWDSITSSWNQLGVDINGESAFDASGSSVSINDLGNIVVIGAPNNDSNGSTSGSVRVYSWDGNVWNKLGADINGESSFNSSGHSVSINSSGDIIAIGATNNGGNGANSGHVRVYVWNGSSWIKRGNDIDGENANSYSGWSVSLNSTGNILAIGAPYNNNQGSVRVYTWNGLSWNKTGADINGISIGENFGVSVSINDEGNIVAIGAPSNNTSGLDTGRVSVYTYNLNSNITPTPTPTNTSTPTTSITPTQTTTITSSITSNITATPTRTATPTNTATPTQTTTPNSMATPTRTATPTNTATPTRTVTPTNTLTPTQITNPCWNILGNTFTSSLSDLSADGNRLLLSDGVYQWSGSQWLELGNLVTGLQLLDAKISANGEHVIVVGSTPLISALKAKVFSWNGSTWTQKGTEISVTNYSVTRALAAISDSGSEIYISVPDTYNAGDFVRGRFIANYSFNGSFWSNPNQLYGNINEFGASISINSDGSKIAVGIPGYIIQPKTGLVRVYNRVNTGFTVTFTQIGEDLYGSSNGWGNNRFGESVELSSDGNILVIGEPTFTPSFDAQKAGRAHIYEFISGGWSNNGVIIGTQTNEALGYSLSLNSTGDFLAVGSPNNIDGLVSNGSFAVYKKINNSFALVGNRISGSSNIGLNISLNDGGTRVAVSSTSETKVYNLDNCPATPVPTNTMTPTLTPSSNSFCKYEGWQLYPIDTEQSGLWPRIALSQDGSKLACCGYGGYIHTSINSGVSWIQRSGAGLRNWTDIVCSTDGQKLVACMKDGYIYTSNDSGLSWNAKTTSGSRWWNRVACSYNCDIIFAAEDFGKIYKSNNNGTTFTVINLVDMGFPNNVASVEWNGIACSDDGTKIFAASSSVGYPGSIYISNDGGSIWNKAVSLNLPDKEWVGISCSGDGQIVVVASKEWIPSGISYSSEVYISLDGGANWGVLTYDMSGLARITDIKISKNGGIIAISSKNLGYIYINCRELFVNFVTPIELPRGDYSCVGISGNGERIVALGNANNYIYVNLQVSPTPTNSATQTRTATPTPTQTTTPNSTATPTRTATPTNSVTPTQTTTPNSTATPTRTATPTNSVTQTPTQTKTPTSSITPTIGSTPTITPTKGKRYQYIKIPPIFNIDCVDICRVQSFTGKPMNNSVILDWILDIDCNSLVKQFSIEYKTNAQSNWNFYSVVSSETRTEIVNGLLNNTSYIFRLSIIRYDNSVSSSYCTVNLTPLPTQSPTPTKTTTPTNTVTSTKTATPTPTASYCPEISICDGFIDDNLIDGGIIVELQVEKNPQCCCNVQLALNNTNVWNNLPSNIIDCSPNLGYSLHPTCFGDIIP